MPVALSWLIVVILCTGLVAILIREWIRHKAMDRRDSDEDDSLKYW